MNATYGKNVFSEKTITVQLGWLAKMTRTQFNKKDTYQSEWHKYNDKAKAISQNIFDRNYDKFLPSFQLLRYQIAMFGIFTERFLNPRYSITTDNVCEEESIVKSIFDFFKMV